INCDLAARAAWSRSPRWISTPLPLATSGSPGDGEGWAVGVELVGVGCAAGACRGGSEATASTSSKGLIGVNMRGDRCPLVAEWQGHGYRPCPAGGVRPR